MGICSDGSYTMEVDCLSNGVCANGVDDNEIDCVGLGSSTWTYHQWTSFGWQD